MKKIETRDDLDLWIKKCNQPMMTKGVVDLQDIFARSEVSTLKKLFHELKDKKMFLWSVQKIMGMDTFFDYVRIYVTRIVNKEIEDFNQKLTDKENQIARREQILYDSKKPIWKKIGDLRKQNEILDRRCEQYKIQEITQFRTILDLQSQIRELKQKENELEVLKDFSRLVCKIGVQT